MRLLTILAAGLAVVIPHASGQATVDSVESGTNGVVVTWTNPTPNQVFTVQVRESLASGTWRNATTRYRWPSPLTRWADAPRNLPASRFYRVVSQDLAVPERGKLVSSSLKGQFSAEQLKTPFVSWGIDGFVQPKLGTISRTVTYETLDPLGVPTVATALMIVPVGTNGPLPLVSVQHGTLVRKSDAPSQPGSGDFWAVALASIGYAVVVPDYLGLGGSPGFQGYLHARSEATCVVDALRAARALCGSVGVSLNGQLFLTGFSQGGHVTMAAHRELETVHGDEFTVTGSAPCAGTYDIGGVTLERMMSDPAYPTAYPFALLVAAYLPIYQLADTLEELLQEPYRTRLPPLLDGTRTEAQLDAVLPQDPFAILRSDYQADFRTNSLNALRRAIRDNNTYDWTPRAPLRLIHCRGDDVAYFAHAEVAYQSFTNRGACCVSLVDPGAPAVLNHEGSFLPSFREVLNWLATFR